MWHVELAFSQCVHVECKLFCMCVGGGSAYIYVRACVRMYVRVEFWRVDRLTAVRS